MESTEPLDIVNKGRARRVHWHEIVKALLELEKTGPLDPEEQPWIQTVARLSGYSANHLRRMATALQGVEVLAEKHPASSKRLLNLPFSHAEILTRLAQSSNSGVTDLLGRPDWVTYNELLRLYEESRIRQAAPKAAGKLASRAFRSRAFRALSADFVSDELIAPLESYRFAKPDFLALQTKPYVSARAAFDCFPAAYLGTRDLAERHMVSVATEASFFTTFWLVVPTMENVELIERAIHELEAANVGILLLSDPGVHIIRHLSGSPFPDRRRHYQNFLQANGSRMLAKWREQDSKKWLRS